MQEAYLKSIISPMKELVQQAKTLLGITLTPAQIAAFEEYERLLLEWNSKFNLTAIRTPEDVRTKHFLDSLTAVQVMRDTPVERVIDVGSGAGFPGIPIKIVCTSMKLTLVESVGKKAAFCSRVAEALKLDGVRVVQSRAEESDYSGWKITDSRTFPATKIPV